MLVSLLGSAIFDQMCSGTIAMLPSSPGSSVNEVDGNVSVTVLSSVATAVHLAPVVLSPGLFWNRVKVKATSFAVKGWPSVHLTPCRVVIVSTVPSAFHEYPVASTGLGFCARAML